jgi:hypothetical protein
MVVPIFMAGCVLSAAAKVYFHGSYQKIIGLIVNLRGTRMQAQLSLISGYLSHEGRRRQQP